MVNNLGRYCKADAVKFQKRSNRELLTPEQYNAPHPNPAFAYGKTYGEHREFLEFTVEQHRELKRYCEEMDIIYVSDKGEILRSRISRIKVNTIDSWRTLISLTLFTDYEVVRPMLSETLSYGYIHDDKFCLQELQLWEYLSSLGESDFLLTVISGWEFMKSLL